MWHPEWYPPAVFYFALLNAAIVATAGLALGVANIFFDDKLEPIRLRTLQIVTTVVGANASAAVALGVMRWLLQ